MKISIFGLGYVGAVSLACLARDGHDIVGVDIDRAKLDLIRDGKSPIIEDSIQELMQAVVASGRVRVTDSAAEAIAMTDVSFVCVGTPAQANGRQDLSAMRRLAEQIGDALREKSDYHVIVVRSTVEPGTVMGMIRPTIEEHSGKKLGEGFGLCFQPEFLREGSSIRDYDNPPFTVVGGDCDRSINTVRGIFSDLPGEFVSTSIATAEMLKYACNSFHALKVTFANEVGRISQALNVDSHEVMRLVCQDTQLNISPAYLRPGFAFGGSCLPKDVKALLYTARRRDINVPMLSSLLPSNRVHIDHAIETVIDSGKRAVGMIGLSFKSGTDDLRESPLVVMAERFIGKGLNLRIFDPEVSIARLIGANRRYIEETIPHISSLMCDNCEELIREAEVVIVGLSDAVLLDAVREHARPGQLVLDLVGMSDTDSLAATYRGVCW